MKKVLCSASASVNAVVYCRVSTKEQVSNLSLGTQETRGIEYCAKQGCAVVRVFRDEGASAKTVDRPEFQKMLTFCKARKNEIRYVVVNDLSRFSRDALDQMTVMQDLRVAGVELRSVTEDINETPTGKLMAGFKAVMNQHENDVKAERTKIGMQKSASLGMFPFKASLGYCNKGTANGPNLVPDPERAPLIKLAFELFATGTKTKVEVLKAVTAAGLTTLQAKPVSAQTFHSDLTESYLHWKGLHSFVGHRLQRDV